MGYMRPIRKASINLLSLGWLRSKTACIIVHSSTLNLCVFIIPGDTRISEQNIYVAQTVLTDEAKDQRMVTLILMQ